MTSTPRDQTRLRVRITGRVQGVFFRESTRQLAERLKLGGWVRNLSDGTVEAVFEGPAAAVAQAVAWTRHGPPGASVDEVQVDQEPPAGERGFRVRGTHYAWERA